ncbi:hypothetical protein, partial [Leptolyngbya sp. PCC 6406]|uniref:hypothetical protein n=1 Tax=Leptolyngbya sp. PCC 6406 TaxID=1173264 RepID=UPI001CEDF61D
IQNSKLKIPVTPCIGRGNRAPTPKPCIWRGIFASRMHPTGYLIQNSKLKNPITPPPHHPHTPRALHHLALLE